MGKKIHVLELKQIEVVEVDGEFEQRFVNVKKYPVYLTNAAMRRGRDMGLIENSLIAEFSKLGAFQDLQGIELAGGENDFDKLEKLSGIDDEPMINVIYLAFIGANKSVKMDFEEFMELYHLDFTETLTLYVTLISESFSHDNNFAAGLIGSTKQDKKK